MPKKFQPVSISKKYIGCISEIERIARKQKFKSLKSEKPNVSLNETKELDT